MKPQDWKRGDVVKVISGDILQVGSRYQVEEVLDAPVLPITYLQGVFFPIATGCLEWVSRPVVPPSVEPYRKPLEALLEILQDVSSLEDTLEGDAYPFLADALRDIRTVMLQEEADRKQSREQVLEELRSSLNDNQRDLLDSWRKLQGAGDGR